MKFVRNFMSPQDLYSAIGFIQICWIWKITLWYLIKMCMIAMNFRRALKEQESNECRLNAGTTHYQMRPER